MRKKTLKPKTPMEITQTHSRAKVATPLSGLIVYENALAYVRALNMYLHLVVHLRREIPFQFTWCSFDELRNAQAAEKARITAASADLVVFAAKPAENWPHELRTWLESWTQPRQKRFGAIGALLTPADRKSNEDCGRQTYLKALAARMGVDFLTAKTEPMPAIADRMEAEPYKVHDFPVIAAAAHQPNASPYYGING